MFRGIKEKIAPSDCDDFLNMLSDDANLLEQILTANVDPELSPRFREINKMLSNINMTGVKQFIPFAMGLLRNCERLKIEKPDYHLRAAERFLFRYNTICNLPSNRVERLFSRISRDLESLSNLGTQKISELSETEFLIDLGQLCRI